MRTGEVRRTVRAYWPVCPAAPDLVCADRSPAGLAAAGSTGDLRLLKGTAGGPTHQPDHGDGGQHADHPQPPGEGVGITGEHRAETSHITGQSTQPAEQDGAGQDADQAQAVIPQAHRTEAIGKVQQGEGERR